MTRRAGIPSPSATSPRRGGKTLRAARLCRVSRLPRPHLITPDELNPALVLAGSISASGIALRFPVSAPRHAHSPDRFPSARRPLFSRHFYGPLARHSAGREPFPLSTSCRFSMYSQALIVPLFVALGVVAATDAVDVVFGKPPTNIRA